MISHSWKKQLELFKAAVDVESVDSRAATIQERSDQPLMQIVYRKLYEKSILQSLFVTSVAARLKAET